MIQALKEWWNFLRHPNLEFRKTERLNRTFWVLLVGQCLLSLASVVLPSQLIRNFDQLEVEDLLRDYQDPVALVMLLIGLAFLEECIFRLPLSHFRVRYLLPSSLLMFLLSVSFKDQFWMQVVLGLSGVLCMVALLGLVSGYRGLVETTWRRAFSGVFYLFAVLFALVHVSNYDFSQHPVPLWQIPLLVVPQFLAGLTFGYVRVSMGFLNGVALHAAYNAVFVLPTFWFPQQPGL